jgi:hypothetical protein
MEYLIGVILTVAVAAFAAVIGFDRERAFYPTVLIVIASYYALFAVMGASTRTLIIESTVAGVFVLFAVLGFKGTIGWWSLLLSVMASLTLSDTSSWTTPVFRNGGRVFAWHLM